MSVGPGAPPRVVEVGNDPEPSVHGAGDGPGTTTPATDHGWPWLVSRVTALFLAVLLPLHFWVVIVRDDIGATTLATVTDRFANPQWQALEWLTLVLALVHATLALRAAVHRSTLSPTGRNRLVAVIVVDAVALGLALTWAMFSLA